MNHGFRLADWSAELAAAAELAEGAEQLQAGEGVEGEGGRQQQQQQRRRRIPNPIDLRVYAVTDPRCNAK